MWLILACTPVEESDARRFARLVGDTPEACQALRDPRLRGHCQLANGAACEEVEPGPWQDECRFVAAEQARDPALCALAGAYTEDCFTHLYKAEVGTDLAESEALERSYDALHESHWQAPWGWWWRTHHQAAERVDRRCPGLDAPQTRRCQREAVPALRLAYRTALASRPRELCGVPLEELREGPLPWVADEALDAAVREELAAACP